MGVATLPKGFLPIDWQEIAENQTVETQFVGTKEKISNAENSTAFWTGGERLEGKLYEGQWTVADCSSTEMAEDWVAISMHTNPRGRQQVGLMGAPSEALSCRTVADFPAIENLADLAAIATHTSPHGRQQSDLEGVPTEMTDCRAAADCSALESAAQLKQSIQKTRLAVKSALHV